MKTKKKIFIGVGIVVAILLVAGSVVWAKSAKYRKFINAFEDTINADSMTVKIEGRVSRDYYVEVFGKDENTIVTSLDDDKDVRRVMDNVYWYKDGKKETKIADAGEQDMYDAFASRDVGYFYQEMRIQKLFGVEYDELYEVGINFVKDYLSKNKRIDFLSNKTKVDNGEYYFEIYFKDFLQYMKDKYNYRSSEFKIDNIPDDATISFKIKLNGKYFKKIECKFGDTTQFLVQFDDVNKITKDNSI